MPRRCHFLPHLPELLLCDSFTCGPELDKLFLYTLEEESLTVILSSLTLFILVAIAELKQVGTNAVYLLYVFDASLSILSSEPCCHGQFFFLQTFHKLVYAKTSIFSVAIYQKCMCSVLRLSVSSMLSLVSLYMQ